jgi:carboxypeptidase Taq
MEAELGPRDDDLRRGETAPIQRWLAEHVHRFGRRLDTIALIEHATGRGLDVDPFLRYASGLGGR